MLAESATMRACRTRVKAVFGESPNSKSTATATFCNDGRVKQMITCGCPSLADGEVL
jgi:hypothetical protein